MLIHLAETDTSSDTWEQDSGNMARSSSQKIFTLFSDSTLATFQGVQGKHYNLI